MLTPPSPPASEISHAIVYNHFGSAVYNHDFSGGGRLTINSDGPTYTFTGKPRGLFAGKSKEMVFGADDITNVAVDGRQILFKTALGRSGKHKQPFAFFLNDAAEAAAVAELLPKNVDTEFTEVQDFQTRLDEVAGPYSTWQSPTNVIIALNALVFIIMGALGAGLVETTNLMPYILYGANNGAATTDGEWWRLLTSMFMHYGIMHLLFNMWALYQAGHLVEKLLGRSLYVLIYLGSGMAGGFASIMWHGDQTWSAGASGAVFGVYGAILGFMLRQKQALPASIYRSLMKSTIAFAAYNILYGLARPGIDNAAHTGGLLGGIFFSWLLAMPIDREARANSTGRRLQLGLGALGLLCVIGVSVTPRYDYSIRDLITWQNGVQPFIEHEGEFLENHQQQITGLGTTTDVDGYADWIEADLIPFYQNWIHALTAMQLKSDKVTSLNRDKLVAVFNQRLKSFDHLVTALRTDDEEEFNLFIKEEESVAEALNKLEQGLE